MKSLIVLLGVMVAFIAGTAWIAQQWRLEATQYASARERDGGILKQQLMSEGEKARAEIVADFQRQGAAQAAQLEAETERVGKTNLTSGEVDRSRLENVQTTTTARDVILPLQGSLAASSGFLARSKNLNLSEQDRQTNRTIYDLLVKARTMVTKERDLMLQAMGDAMRGPTCAAERPR